MSLDQVLENRRRVLKTLDEAALEKIVQFLRSFLGRQRPMRQDQIVSGDLYKAVRVAAEPALGVVLTQQLYSEALARLCSAGEVKLEWDGGVPIVRVLNGEAERALERRLAPR